MANDLNSTTLVGRLARDPELRALQSGSSLCSLRLAYSTSQKDGSGQYQDKSNFIDVTVWGSQGETVARLLKKGARVGISGRLEHREYQDKDGNRREAHQIVAHAVQFLDPKSDASAPAQASAPPAQPAAQPAVPADDDIPF